MRDCLLAAKKSALNRNISCPSALFSVGNRSAASKAATSRLRKTPGEPMHAEIVFSELRLRYRSRDLSDLRCGCSLGITSRPLCCRSGGHTG